MHNTESGPAHSHLRPGNNRVTIRREIFAGAGGIVPNSLQVEVIIVAARWTCPGTARWGAKIKQPNHVVIRQLRFTIRRLVEICLQVVAVCGNSPDFFLPSLQPQSSVLNPLRALHSICSPHHLTIRQLSDIHTGMNVR